MTNWIAANLVTWIFDISNLKNVVENTKSGYIYKTTFNHVATSKMGLDVLFPDSQVNGGIVVAIILAIIIFIILTRTTFGYQLKACGSNRFAARYAGIKDKRNIVLSMAIAGSLAGAAGSLYYLSGNTEFFWSTYQSLPRCGLQRHSGGASGGQPSHRRHLHGHVHVHAGYRGPADDQPHRLQRIHHGRDHRRDRVSERLLAID